MSPLPSVWAIALCVFIATKSTAQPADHEKGWRLTPICGVWNEECMLVSYSSDFNCDDYKHCFERGVLSLTSGQSAEISGRIRYEPTNAQMRNGTFKINLGDTHLWLVAPGDSRYFVLPVDHVQYLELGDWSTRLLIQKFGKKFSNEWYQESTYSVNALFFHPAPGETTSSATPLPDARSESTEEPLTPERQQYQYITLVARYDLIPTGETTFTSVHLNTKFLEFEELTLKPSKAKKEIGTAVPTDPKKEKVSVEAPFKGDFWAYKVGKVYYIYVHTGELYVVQPAPDKGKLDWEIKAVWDDKKKPLVGAVQDIARNKLFFFGREGDGKDGKRFAFECDGSLKPKPTEYKSSAKPTDGFRESQDCIAVFAKELKKR